MAHRHHLHPGDRVNWPNDRRDRGTVIREAGKLIIVWDRRVDGGRAHDLNEVAHDGLLSDFDVRVELHERGTTLAIRRKMAEDATRRMKTGLAADERAQNKAREQRTARYRHTPCY